MFLAVELQVLPTFVVGEFVFMLLSLITLIHAVKQVMRIQRRSNKITSPAIPSYVRQAWNCLYLISHFGGQKCYRPHIPYRRQDVAQEMEGN